MMLQMQKKIWGTWPLNSRVPSSPPITALRRAKWGKWFSRFSSSPLWFATLLLSLALAVLYSRWLKQNLKPSRATHPSLRAVTLLCLHPKWQLPQSPPQSHHPTVTGWDLGPFPTFGVNDGWRQRPCSFFPLSGIVVSATSHRGRPFPSWLWGWRVMGPAPHTHPAPFKGLLRNLASPPPCSPTYSIPGSICHLLAAFQGSEAHSVSLLSSQTADWQNKRQQVQFITSFIIQNPE